MIQEHEVRGTCKTFATLGRVTGDGHSFGRHLLTKQELASVLGVSPRTISSWTAQKRIPFLRFSARFVRFNLERVKTALARYEIKEAGAR